MATKRRVVVEVIHPVAMFVLEVIYPAAMFVYICILIRSFAYQSKT